MSRRVASVVVLAAGQGKRMRSSLPKVLHPVCGQPMLCYVLAAAASVGAERVVVVLGHGHEQTRSYVPPDCVSVLQEQQLGTGHALLAAAEILVPGEVLVLPGDVPLLTGAVLQQLISEHDRSGAAATVLTMELEDPTGYGRIIRDDEGWVAAIVEQTDATTEQLALKEVNAGIYVLPVPLVVEVLREVGRDNSQGEIYLTDAIARLRDRGLRVAACRLADPTLALGVNSPEELARADEIMREAHGRQAKHTADKQGTLVIP